MKAKASFRGHPIHPALIGVPIGMLLSALLLDAIALYAQPTNWMPAATVLTIVGTIVLVLAMIPGFIDYTHVVPKEGPVRKTANRHMVLGLMLGGLFVASAIIHGLAWRGLDATLVGAAFWLNLIGAAGLGVQGWLGGELVFKGHVAVVEAHEQTRREHRGEARREKRRTPTRA